MESKEFIQALNYFNGVKNYNLSLSTIELNTMDGINSYSRLLSEISINPSDAKTIPIRNAEIKRVYDLSSQILNLIFASYKSQEYIHALFERVAVTGTSPFDGSVVLADGKEFITVGRNDKIQSIPTLTHEGTHIIVPFSYTENCHILDTLPILTELISALILDGMHIGSDNFNNCLIQRISNLKEQMLNRDKEVAVKGINEAQYVRAYRRHLFYNYLISFVYAINLLKFYLEGAPEFLNKLNNSLMYDSDLYDLLKYYGIDFSSNETVDTTINVLKNTP